ncbi:MULTISPECIES: hypothetical protein [unclassified Legionella]|uniref:hypothetical protein n=1 Tax=unclassified Legionella TaxID=2622702 RepID=UPI003AF9267A
MNNETTNTKPNYIIHCIYASAFLLAILIFISYQVWNRIQINNEIKAKDEKHRIYEEAQILKAKKQQEKTSSCLTVVSNMYERAWAKACVSENQRMKTAYENCLREAKSLTDYVFSHSPEDRKKFYLHKANECKSIYQFTSLANLNCTLPKSLAEGLNMDLNKMEARCREDT